MSHANVAMQQLTVQESKWHCSKFQNRISDPKRSLTMRLCRQDVFVLKHFLVPFMSPIITVHFIGSICLALRGKNSIDCKFWHNWHWPSCRSVRLRPYLSIFNEATLFKYFMNMSMQNDSFQYLWFTWISLKHHYQHRSLGMEWKHCILQMFLFVVFVDSMIKR